MSSAGPSGRDDGISASDVVEIVPSGGNPAAKPADTGARRRSNRIANKGPQRGQTSSDWLAAEQARTAARKAELERREEELEQVQLVAAGVDDIPPQPYRVVMSPYASALLQLHAHFARTEVIGYLAGVVCDSPPGSDGNLQKTMYILEACPVRNLSSRDLAKEGRSALYEVEMNPESACEVQMRIQGKGLSIVGWYHSHPFFSPLPSDIDVQNQNNQQTMLFGDAPYVAAICSPFWEDLPDARSKVDMFYVHCGDVKAPVEVKYIPSYEIPTRGARGASDFFDSVSLFKETAENPCTGMNDAEAVRTRQRSVLENEAMSLISVYSQFARRMNLDSDWRPGVTVYRKLGLSLKAVACLAGNVHVRGEDDQAPSDDPDPRFQPVGQERGGRNLSPEAPSTRKETIVIDESSASDTGASPEAPPVGRPDVFSRQLTPEGIAESDVLECAEDVPSQELQSLWDLLKSLVSLACESWTAQDEERSKRSKRTSATSGKRKRKRGK